MSKITKKENLVILSGWTRDEISYKELISSAPLGWKVFVPSYQELKPHKGLDVFHENFLAYLKKNNIDKFNLLGHSLGGGLALHFASKYHDRIKRLFLIDSKGVYESESIISGVKNLIKEHLKRSLVDNVEDFLRVIENPILNFRLGLTAHYSDAVEQAKKIKIDTHIFWGEKDYMTPVAHGQKLKSLIKNSKLLVLKEMGHDWILSAPEHFWDKLDILY